MRIPGERAHHLLEAGKAARAGIGLVRLHHRRPLRRAHGGRAGVGEEIERHRSCRDEKEVVASLSDDALALLAAEQHEGLHLLDLEGLDDGPLSLVTHARTVPRVSAADGFGARKAERPQPNCQAFFLPDGYTSTDVAGE
jgi:hypothetical protein